MKKSHIRMTKETRRKETHHIALCGDNDQSNVYIDALAFCSLPDVERCAQCKSEMIILLCEDC